MTVNELLVLMKVVRQRLSSLIELRKEVSTKERWLREAEKIIEPQYDVRKLDVKVLELEKFLYKADTAIKQSNAKTQVDIQYDIDVLLTPLE